MATEGLFGGAMPPLRTAPVGEVDYSALDALGIPRSILASDLWFQAGQGDDPLGQFSNYGIRSTGDPYAMFGGGSGRDYGHFGRNFSASSPNWTLAGADPRATADPFSGAFFDLLMKSGDKQGTTVRYNRQGDEWVPDVSSMQNTYWDTNPNEGMALLPIGMFAGAGLASGLFGGGAGAATGAAEGLTMLPNAGWSIAGPGAGAATEAMIAGLPVAGGAGAAAATPGLLSGITNSLPSWAQNLVSQFGPSVLEGGVNALLGRNQEREGRLASQNLRDLETGNAANLRNAANQYSAGLFSLGSEYAPMYDPFYANVTTGFGTATVDPVTGQVRSQLSDPYQRMRDQSLEASQGMFGQLRDFNPQTFATERYNAAQALLAPGDQLAQQGLMQELANKGGFGLTLNQPAQPGAAPGAGVTPGAGTVGVNPYIDTFLNAQNRRNAQMSYDALGQGERYLDNLINRQQGMFNFGAGIDQYGRQNISDMFNASNQLMGDRRRGADFRIGLGERALRMPYEAERDYLNAVTGANRDFMNRSSQAQTAQGNTYWDIAANMPWGSIWNSIFGK